ncbi:MAG: SRPBCC family protein [Gemmatimonadales bacterium]|jgi:ligand-binding SRPBCC domain-containing protein
MRRRDREYVLERTQGVTRPLEEVFQFFSDPRNLARLTPPWLAFRALDSGDLTMREGLRIHYRIRLLGVPQRWTSVITVWDPPHRFVDEQLRGPYRRWHHLHEFTRSNDGTQIRDRVTYQLPFGPLGRLAHVLFVRRQLEAIFTYRRHRVEELF